jgi:hypothetical protein
MSGCLGSTILLGVLRHIIRFWGTGESYRMSNDILQYMKQYERFSLLAAIII